ncbi:SDR family oxidoreductase [Streptomyces fuscigenes]|uniref:SDR family oxidoreductase n=1 Tax=Streptomyces fuscigenes TaxID=1528880 RepID=UPI001F2DF14F|nr:SDR family oxidoreductase [Streptomyces fuscigenes]MCF3961547.1 SDR family oxidoreductase [Streptomyces fuscigenes]
MRVFVTGASGHIASAVVPLLVAAGHEVAGLARSDASAAAVAALGAEVVRGDLDDIGGLRKAAASADGVMHFAFKHDAMARGDFAGAVASDLRVLTAFGEELDGTGKALVAMGGTMMLAPDGRAERPVTEEDTMVSGPRVDAENLVAGLAGRGVRSSVVRLSPVVHSSLDHHGFAPILIGLAREKGYAGYVGDGANRWPAVHTLDAARLCALALEQAPAGSRLHAVADEGVPFREFAERIGRHLGLPARSVDPEDADAHFGFLGRLVGRDNPISSARTRELLGWEPVHPGLLDDLDLGHYFATGA